MTSHGASNDPNVAHCRLVCTECCALSTGMYRMLRTVDWYIPNVAHCRLVYTACCALSTGIYLATDASEKNAASHIAVCKSLVAVNGKDLVRPGSVGVSRALCRSPAKVGSERRKSPVFSKSQKYISDNSYEHSDFPTAIPTRWHSCTVFY
jgi:hypothetical protein